MAKIMQKQFLKIVILWICCVLPISPSPEILQQSGSEHFSHTSSVICSIIEFSSDCQSRAGTGKDQQTSCKSCPGTRVMPPNKKNSTCPKLFVSVRHKGLNIRLEDCQAVDIISCGIPVETKTYACYKGECETLHGLFNCSQPTVLSSDGAYGSHCQNLTASHTCAAMGYGFSMDCYKSARNCLNIDGLYKCSAGECRKLTPPNCQRRCPGIRTEEKTVIIRHGEKDDKVLSTRCKRALNSDTWEEIWPLNHRSHSSGFSHSHSHSRDSNSPPVLLMSCATLTSSNNGQTFLMSDCTNGVYLDSDFFEPITDRATLAQIHEQAIGRETNERAFGLDDKLVGPTESELSIQSRTLLFSNYEGCARADDCAKFFEEYYESNQIGDGDGGISTHKFQCYFTENSTYPLRTPELLHRNMAAQQIWIGSAFISVPLWILFLIIEI